MNILIGNVLSLFSSLAGIKYSKQTDKDAICMWALCMNFLKLIAMIFLNAISGIPVITLNIFRAVLVRFSKFNKYVLILYTIINLIFCLYTWENFLDLCPFIGSTLNSLGFYFLQKSNIVILRKLRFCGNILWTAYYLYVLDIIAVLFEISYTIINLIELKRCLEN